MKNKFIDMDFNMNDYPELITMYENQNNASDYDHNYKGSESNGFSYNANQIFRVIALIVNTNGIQNTIIDEQ